jgi:hypothetical protein
MEYINKELTVIGAGLSGVCAAVMASRKGLKVALISDRPVLGGNSSSEMRMWTRGSTGGENIYAEEMGILGEMKLKNLYRNPEANVLFWDEVLFDTVLDEKNIQLFLNTHVNRVVLDGNTCIKEVGGYQQGTEKEFLFESDVFIDASGDGSVGFLAGLDFIMGREGKEVYGEKLAPEYSDENGLGSSIFFHSKSVDEPVSYIPPDFAYSHEEIAKILGKGGRIVNEHMNGTDFWWLEFGGTMDTIRDNQDITIELKRIVFGIWNYIKNSGLFEADNLTLEWVGTLPCKRESRRFKGAHILKQQDIEENKFIDDGVCYGGWYMDFHPPEGIYSSENFCSQTPVALYAIPMRSLYSRKIHNLLFVGRTISVTHSVFSSSRIMNTCALTGQAAGMIAAYMVQKEQKNFQIFENYLKELQLDLIKNDMFIPGITRDDVTDSAKNAVITASSVRSMENSTSYTLLPLKDDFYFLFPGLGADAALDLLLNFDEDCILDADIYECAYPAGFQLGEKIQSFSIQSDSNIKSRDSQYYRLPFAGNLGTSYFLVLKRNEKCKINISNESCTGFIGRFKKHKRMYHPSFKTEGVESFYKAENISSEYNRPYVYPHLWMSQDEKQSWLQLKWDQKIDINEIRIFFNPDLSVELVNVKGAIISEHHGFVGRDTMPPELVKKYTVSIKEDTVWKEIARDELNIKRMVVIPCHIPVQTDVLRVEFFDTWGSSSFQVFSVGVY